MARVVRIGQGKPRPAKNNQGHDQGCQRQLDKPELEMARTMARGRIGHGSDRPTELGQLRLGIDQSMSNQSGRGQAR